MILSKIQGCFLDETPEKSSLQKEREILFYITFLDNVKERPYLRVLTFSILIHSQRIKSGWNEIGEVGYCRFMRLPDSKITIVRLSITQMQIQMRLNISLLRERLKKKS